MAAHFTRHFSRSLPERVLIFLAKWVKVLPLLFFLAIHKNAGGIISEGALGADNGIQAAVRPRADHVMLKQNGAPLGGLDDAGIHVAADIFFRAFGIALGKVGFDVFSQGRLGWTHRDHVIKLVAAMN